ncbi:MAG: glycoside hydrolase family 1 protein [Coprobacillus sp.]
MKTNHFPSDFLWGGSISAHQCEGSYNKDGKGLAIMDLVGAGSHQQMRKIYSCIEEGVFYPNHTGIDFYTCYKEDIAMFADLGFTALRISIDWSRIFPNGDDETPNQKGLQFYHNVIDELLKYSIEPIVTIYHFELPLHIVKKYQSWYQRKTVDLYLRYCETLFKSFKGKVKKWITFNEMNHLDLDSPFSDTFTYILTGLKLSQFESKDEFAAKIAYHVCLASVKAVELAHQIDDKNEVGCVFGLTPFYANTCRPLDALTAFQDFNKDLYQIDAMTCGHYPIYKLKEYKNKGIQLDILKEDQDSFRNGKIDFIGINYYCTEVSSFEPLSDKKSLFGGYPNPYLEETKWDLTIDPIGLRYVLNVIDRKYHLPILITENGIGLNDVLVDGKVHDPARVDYLEKHFKEIDKAINQDFVNCIGYLMWGPIDVVSATSGEMKKRYGFIYVDKNDDGTGTYQRYKKDSYDWFKEFIK